MRAAVRQRDFEKVIGWNFHPEMLSRLEETAAGAGRDLGTTDASDAFRNSGRASAELYAEALALRSGPVQPAQAYGIVNALLLAGILLFFSRLRWREGQVFAMMLILYPITRIVLESIRGGRGCAFAVMMARQAGKNELSGQLEAYLLNLYQRAGGQIVKASPTFKPQTINSILRLCDRLDSPWTAGRWRRREGYIVELGRARALFFSAAPTANVVAMYVAARRFGAY